MTEIKEVPSYRKDCRESHSYLPAGVRRSESGPVRDVKRHRDEASTGCDLHPVSLGLSRETSGPVRIFRQKPEVLYKESSVSGPCPCGPLDLRVPNDGRRGRAPPPTCLGLASDVVVTGRLGVPVLFLRQGECRSGRNEETEESW